MQVAAKTAEAVKTVAAKKSISNSAEKIKRKHKAHAKNVINANYAKKNRLRFSVENIDDTVFSSDAEYTRRCMLASENIEAVMAGAGISINGRNWDSLTPSEQDEVINLRCVWDPKTEFDVDKNGSVICGIGFIS